MVMKTTFGQTLDIMKADMQKKVPEGDFNKGISQPEDTARALRYSTFLKEPWQI